MFLNIMFIIGVVCSFAFIIWAETENKDDLNDECIEKDCPYDEDKEN